MFHSKICIGTLVTVLSILSVQAQNDSPPTCQTATGMLNLNATQLSGNWYEEIRTAPKNISCALFVVNVVNNQTELNITAMYSGTKNGLLMDQNNKATVNVTDVQTNSGFNVTFNSANAVTTTYKILSTDYTSNIVICGYTNASDPSTSFGAILTRMQIVNSTWLMEVKSNASQILPSFNGSTAVNITQSVSCYTGSAATSVPALATLFATFYALLKFLY